MMVATIPSDIVSVSKNAGNGKYKPQLDGLRTFCILFTVFNHIPGAPGYINGTVGVDVFFALSGWLITWLLFNERTDRGSINLKAFYVRRIFRIVPLYFVVAILYAALALANLKAGASDELQAAWPYIVTFNMEYRPEAAGNLFGHAWTLGIEEKFYIFWPLILAVFGLHTGRAWCIALAAVVGIILIGATTEIARGYIGLAFGATAAVTVRSLPNLSKFLNSARLAGPFFCVIGMAYVGSLIVNHDFGWNIVISFFAALAIASMWMNEDQLVNRFLSWQPLVWLGTLTYAIYLVQTLSIRIAAILNGKTGLPVDGWALFVTAYGVSVIVAFALHILVEQPFIHRGRAIAKRVGDQKLVVSAT